MARLPVEQREVIGLVLVEGLSYKEAAEIIGAPLEPSPAGWRAAVTHCRHCSATARESRHEPF